MRCHDTLVKNVKKYFKDRKYKIKRGFNSDVLVEDNGIDISFEVKLSMSEAKSGMGQALYNWYHSNKSFLLFPKKEFYKQENKEISNKLIEILKKVGLGLCVWDEEKNGLTIILDSICYINNAEINLLKSALTNKINEYSQLVTKLQNMKNKVDVLTITIKDTASKLNNSKEQKIILFSPTLCNEIDKLTQKRWKGQLFIDNKNKLFGFKFTK